MIRLTLFLLMGVITSNLYANCTTQYNKGVFEFNQALDLTKKIDTKNRDIFMEYFLDSKDKCQKLSQQQALEKEAQLHINNAIRHYNKALEICPGEHRDMIHDVLSQSHDVDAKIQKYDIKNHRRAREKFGCSSTDGR